jgi:hypothetical protein
MTQKNYREEYERFEEEFQSGKTKLKEAQLRKIEAHVESELDRLYAQTSDLGRQLFDGIENFRKQLVGIAVDLPPTKGHMPDIEGAWKLTAGSSILRAGIEKAPSRQVRRDLERRLRKLEAQYPIA